MEIKCDYCGYSVSKNPYRGRIIRLKLWNFCDFDCYWEAKIGLFLVKQAVDNLRKKEVKNGIMEMSRVN